MSARIGTHWEDCWKTHTGCAKAEVERLRSELTAERCDGRDLDTQVKDLRQQLARRDEALRDAEDRIAGAWSATRAAYDRLQRQDEALRNVLATLNETRWVTGPSVGSMTEWSRTPEGLNHGHVYKAMALARAALASERADKGHAQGQAKGHDVEGVPEPERSDHSGPKDVHSAAIDPERAETKLHGDDLACPFCCNQICTCEPTPAPATEPHMHSEDRTLCYCDEPEPTLIARCPNEHVVFTGTTDELKANSWRVCLVCREPPEPEGTRKVKTTEPDPWCIACGGMGEDGCDAPCSCTKPDPRDERIRVLEEALSEAWKLIENLTGYFEDAEHTRDDCDGEFWPGCQCGLGWTERLFKVAENAKVRAEASGARAGRP